MSADTRGRHGSAHPVLTMRARTFSQVYSLSKVRTATATAAALQRGLVELDAPVSPLYEPVADGGPGDRPRHTLLNGLRFRRHAGDSCRA